MGKDKNTEWTKGLMGKDKNTGLGGKDISTKGNIRLDEGETQTQDMGKDKNTEGTKGLTRERHKHRIWEKTKTQKGQKG